MKLALIPPTEMLDFTSLTGYQLCLPQMILNDEHYREVYEAHCADPNQYVILDNGAAEGELFDSDALVQMAISLGVDELVIPDAMRQYNTNMHRAINFVTTYTALLRESDIKLMFVAQGETNEQIKMSIDFAGMWDRIGSIGIPRHLIQTLGWDRARYENAHFAAKMTDKPVHLLGGSPVLPDEIGLYDWPENVRGTDTSAPFNFAYNGLSLKSAFAAERPNDYFNLTRYFFPTHVLSENVEMLMQWCAGE